MGVGKSQNNWGWRDNLRFSSPGGPQVCSEGAGMENPQSLHSTSSRIHPTTTKKRIWSDFTHSERVCCTPFCPWEFLAVFSPSQQGFIYPHPHPLQFSPSTLSFLSHQRCSSSSSSRLSAVNPHFFATELDPALQTRSSEEQVDFQKINLILITNCAKYLPWSAQWLEQS